MPAFGLPAGGLFGLGPFEPLGHLSYLLVAVSFLLRDILLLRLVAIVATTCNLVFSYYGGPAPNWIAVMWQATFTLINMAWSVRLVYERRGIRFSEQERELYETVFRAFAPFEFMKLMRLARWEEAGAGAALAKAGAVLPDIMLIYDGEVEVTLADGSRRRLVNGAFVGEISFIRGGAATADVHAVGPTRIVRWSKQELGLLLRRNPAMRSLVHGVLSEDLTQKLLAPVGPRGG